MSVMNSVKTILRNQIKTIRPLSQSRKLSNKCYYYPDLLRTYSTQHADISRRLSVIPLMYNMRRGSDITCHAYCVRGASLQVRCFHLCINCSAGHNKWSKVRHIKGPKDQQRAVMIVKMVKQIRIAIRDGGPNPTSNSALEHAIKLAKDKGVPKATIDNTLNHAVKSKGNSFILEAKGPLGCLFLIDVSAERMAKPKSELSRILNKHGGSMVDSGSALRAFSRKGILKVPAQTSEHRLTEEDAMDVAIEAGAEDVEATEDDENKMVFMFYCDPKDMREVRSNLISLKYEPESTNIDYIVENPQIIDHTNLEEISQLVETLEEHENVLRVYHNVAVEEGS